MRKFYTILTALFCTSCIMVQAQNFSFERRIMVTDTVEDEGIFFAASSDDAEQENDEIDALFDDDLDAGWEGAPEDQNILTCGMRFRNVLIPQGATIDSAFITVWSHEGKSSDDVARLTIVTEATDNAGTFTEDALITDRAQGSQSVVWEVDEEWEIWEPYRTPDLAELVQEVVDRGGWDAGNAISFLFKGEDQGPSDFENAREWESFENISDPEDGGDGQNHPERVPLLSVYYSVQSGRIEIPIMVTDTIEDEGIVFAASSDDAEQENDEIDALYDDDLDAGWEGAPEDQNILTCGLRFRNLAIPHGARIDSAFVMVWSHEGKSSDDVARLTIVAEATDDAETFTEDALITDRPQTDEEVVWEVDEEWLIWEMYRTPDLSAVVQEVVDRSGWSAGNSIALLFKGEDQGPSDFENAREWESFENISDPEDGGDGQNHPERVPRLVIYYSSGGSSSVRSLAQGFHQLLVYPNPVADATVTVALESEHASKINLFNIDGQLVYSRQFEFGNQQQIDVSNLVAGTYIVRADQNGKSYISKLIIAE